MEHVAEFEDEVMFEIEDKPYLAPSSIPVVPGPKLRSGVSIIAGVIPFGALMEHYEIPYYNYTTKRGYQRPPQMARVSQFATEIKRGRVDFPTAILLNLRSSNATSTVAGGQLSLEKLSADKVGGKFFVVDGQHRILALKKAYEDGWRKSLELEIPFTCMVGADEDQEMEQFYVVNSNAKSVRTDLAYALLKKRSESEPGLMESLQEKGREWQVIGQSIVERLAVESSVWRHQIRLPGMAKGDTTIPSASMVASLKPVLASPYFKRLGADQQLRVLEAFWEGIRDVVRDAFDHPTEYSIQKGVGVMVLHSVLPEVLELVRDKGSSPTEPDTYSRLLEESLNGLEGESAEGKLVSGTAFWAAAPKGAAGSYSSSAGLRVLIAKIRSRLPELEFEDD
jgi:DGQHR domain-containing protein